MYILQPNTPRAFSHSKNCLSEPGIDFTDFNGRDEQRPTAPATQAGVNQNGKVDQQISAVGSTPAMAAAPVDVTPTAALTRDLNQMDLKREEVRLVTFDNANWDVPFLNTGKLAQIGFYYMGVQDVVKCFFCKVEIGKWEPQDDCFTEHIRWSPSCPLLRRHPTENVPIDAEELYQILPPITYDTCGPVGSGIVIRPHAFAERSFTPSESGNEFQSGTGSSRSVASTVSTAPSSDAGSPVLSQAMPMFGSSPVTDNNSESAAVAAPSSNQMYPGIPGPTPSYYNTFSHLEIEANRLKTFKEWPIQLKMKPAELSDAGFFYTGGGDRVQCFSCGGGLKNWEDNDVAWEQHALWYSNCEYLKLIKGPKYIAAVQEIHRQANEDQHHGEGSASASSDGEDNEEETVESAEEDEASGVSQSPRLAPRQVEAEGGEGDVIPSTSRASQIFPESGERVKIAPRRRRRVAKNCDSHPESEINSPEAILAAKSAKPSEVPETKLCKICFECEFNTAFLPCGHVVACAKCASAVSTCPVCREPFDTVTRIYFS